MAYIGSLGEKYQFVCTSVFCLFDETLIKLAICTHSERKRSSLFGFPRWRFLSYLKNVFQVHSTYASKKCFQDFFSFILSSPEPKAQVSLSDHNLSFVRCRRCCCKLFTFSSSPESLGQFQPNLMVQCFLG